MIYTITINDDVDVYSYFYYWITMLSVLASTTLAMVIDAKLVISLTGNN